MHMKIWIGNKFIDSAYFRTWCLNEEYNMVYFIHQPKSGYQGEFSLPLIFSSAEEAKRFYDESWNAIADGTDAIWCLDEKATFCWKLYFKIHSQMLKERKAKKLKKQQTHEDIDKTREPENGTVQGSDAPRKGWFHYLLLHLPLRGRRRRSDRVPGPGTNDVHNKQEGKGGVPKVPQGS